jgi:hypothetical protein
MSNSTGVQIADGPRAAAAMAVLGLAAVAVLHAGPQAPSDRRPELDAVLTHDLHFTPADLADLGRGRIVKHTLPPAVPEEIGVAGAVHIRGPRARLIAAYRDIVSFKKSSAVLEIGRFSDPPTSADLDALTTDRDDFDLRRCKISDCDIRLPASAIQHIAASVDWRSPDADGQASSIFKHVLLTHVKSYATGAEGLVTQYDDDRRAVRPQVAGRELIATSPSLDALKPGLAAHVTCFWANPLDGAEDFLYWTKEKFSIAPFISVTHVTIVPAGPHQSIATSRDVYSSRYIDASLSLMIASDAVGDSSSFYLVYVNRSRASALRGPMSGLRRAIAEHQLRKSLDNSLRDVKARLFPEQ